MIDQEKWIASQSVMKELIAKAPENGFEHWVGEKFKFCLSIMEEYATLSPNDEWVNTEISIGKEFWNQTPQVQAQWLTEWGKPMPVINKVGRKEWYVHAQRINLEKIKKEFDKREDNFQSMIKKQEAKI
jgi:hypothetical protein